MMLLRKVVVTYLHTLYIEKLQNFDEESQEMLDDLTLTALRLEDKIKKNSATRFKYCYGNIMK